MIASTIAAALLTQASAQDLKQVGTIALPGAPINQFGIMAINQKAGLGYLIMNAQYLMSVHLLYVGVIVLALLGIASNWALVALERRLGAWRPDLSP